eukprot:scaffold2857_cov399-Prasinococcus_capsulatus_cf.AAC.10
MRHEQTHARTHARAQQPPAAVRRAPRLSLRGAIGGLARPAGAHAACHMRHVVRARPRLPQRVLRPCSAGFTVS